MKLLKPKTGYWVFGGGNVNTVTTLVEVRWLEFRTGVRFPSSPYMTLEAQSLSVSFLVFTAYKLVISIK